MRNEKLKEVSARVLLTPMPQDGVDQFTFLRPIGDLKPEEVEAWLEFHVHSRPLEIVRAVNKLLSSFIANDETGWFPEDMLAIERLVEFLASAAGAKYGEFTPFHKTFIVDI